MFCIILLLSHTFSFPNSFSRHSCGQYYTCISNQSCVLVIHSERRKKIRNFIGKPLACFMFEFIHTYTYIYINVYSYERFIITRETIDDETHISCVDRFRFHFHHFQFSNCYYSHKQNFHSISLYFFFDKESNQMPYCNLSALTKRSYTYCSL